LRSYPIDTGTLGMAECAHMSSNCSITKSPTLPAYHNKIRMYLIGAGLAHSQHSQHFIHKENFRFPAFRHVQFSSEAHLPYHRGLLYPCTSYCSAFAGTSHSDPVLPMFPRSRILLTPDSEQLADSAHLCHEYYSTFAISFRRFERHFIHKVVGLHLQKKSLLCFRYYTHI